MYAQTTFPKNPTNRGLQYTHKVSRNAEIKRHIPYVWLAIYAVLAFLINIMLGLVALIVWSEQPSQVNLAPTQPAIEVVGDPPAVQLPPDQSQVALQPMLSTVADAGQSLPSQPTAEAVPELPIIDMGGAISQPMSVIAESMEAAQPAIRPAPSDESGEPAPINSPLSLDMEENYHWQLSVPGGESACGPTALLIALDYYNLEDSLGDVIVATSLPPEDGGFDPTCTANAVCTSPQALARVAAETYGLDVDAREGWTFEEIYVAVSEGSPVIADIAWDAQSGDLGHFVVIFGVDPVNKVVIYHDPYRGAGLSTTWEIFQAQWSDPVDLDDPVHAGGYRSWGMAIYMR